MALLLWAAAAAAQAGAQPDGAPNGIWVDRPKIYDSRTLRQLLAGLVTQLQAMTAYDRGAVIPKVGGTQGATSSQVSGALQFLGPATPGVMTLTNQGPGATTVTNTQTTNGPAPNSYNASTTPTTIENETETQQAPPTNTIQTTANAPQNTPAAPAAPTTTPFTLPSSFGVSAGDALNEEAQLADQVTGLELLLQGADDDLNRPGFAGG